MKHDELVETIRGQLKGPRPTTRGEVISIIEKFRSTLPERFKDPLERLKVAKEYAKLFDAILTAEEIAARVERTLEGQKL